ncbi:MAG: trimethylamine methyltransferase family protein [Rhizobiales bacterium]|nr:trimethylamine methyltransferase family protein [Hyphomicrobiales bacterium]MBI3672043.1 trimethylamine methyltransferase family protein [Hyphomicrobiales bacterium]
MTAERHGRRSRPADLPIAQLPFAQPRLTLEPARILSDDQIETIHRQSLRVLKEIGMDVLLPEARDILAKAGASVSGERVRLGAEIVEAALKTPPAEFTFHARNPAHHIRIGGNWIAFAPVGGPPNCSDLDRGRRPGSLEDNANFVRLSQFFNCVHTAGGGSVDALDVHASIRHLHIMRNKVRLSDKVPFVVSTGRARLFDSLEIARLARGISRERFLKEPSAYTVINTNSPLKLDNPMAMGVIEMARLNQICVLTPFTLAGAMAPVTLAGALVEQNAEALFGLALSQHTNPGAPFVYGGFTSNVDMKSGAPAFGTPEYMKACIAGGQLARRYKLPYRTSSTNAANSVDAQAAYETVFSLWGAIMGGGNVIQHAAGWMEGGLVASYEKFALDADLLQMLEVFLAPLVVDDDSMGFDAMLEVGPGGHFFGAKHTLERYATAFYQPLISDWRNFQSWQQAGSPQAVEKANALWKQALAQYREPPMDAAIAEEIDAFVARRIAEGGEPTDF